VGVTNANTTELQVSVLPTTEVNTFPQDGWGGRGKESSSSPLAYLHSQAAASAAGISVFLGRQSIAPAVVSTR